MRNRENCLFHQKGYSGFISELLLILVVSALNVENDWCSDMTSSCLRSVNCEIVCYLSYTPNKCGVQGKIIFCIYLMFISRFRDFCRHILLIE